MHSDRDTCRVSSSNKGRTSESQLQGYRRIDVFRAGDRLRSRCARSCADRRQDGPGTMGGRLRATSRRADPCRPDQPAQRAAADRPQGAGQGHRRARGDREGHADLGGRDLHLLDLRRHRAGKLHPRAPGRHGRVPPQEQPQQQDAAQHRPARRHRAGRRCRLELHGAGARVAVHVQGAERGHLHLPLRDGAGGHARRQRHVRADPGRAPRRPQQGRPRVLRDAGRLLHDRQVPREGPATLRHGKGDR